MSRLLRFTFAPRVLCRVLCLLGLMLLCLPVQAVELPAPHFHGALRTRYELATGSHADGAERFQVRNARLIMDGNLAPSIYYFVQTDLCDRGKMKILDAYGRIGLFEGFTLQGGQFRVPFGTIKAPTNYTFSNRSFIGKHINNVRGTGAKIAYTRRALTLEAAGFNPTSIADHDLWVHSLAYAGKAILKLPEGVTLMAGVQTLVPDSIRINSVGGSATWTSGRWTVEGEYMNKHYTHRKHKAAHAWNLQADYRMPIKAGVFNRLSFQGRWDGLTDHSSGTRNKEGLLVTDDPARQRLTAGSTLTYAAGAVRYDLRLSYEKYFYRHHTAPPSLNVADKLCAELVIRF